MKKQSFITVLLYVLMSMVGTKALAYDIAVENADGVTIYYNYTNNEGELEVTYKTTNGTSYSGDVVIPSSVVYQGNTYSVTSIGDGAFSTLVGINSKGEFVALENWVTSITIPSSVKSIGWEAFRDSGLTSITIPNSVTSIGWGAISECSYLSEVVSEIENPFTIDETVFRIIPSNAKLIVPKGTKSKYQATEGWNCFTNIIEVGDVGYEFEVDGINYLVGENNTVSVILGKTKYAGNVVIPSQVIDSGTTYSVTSIGQCAFDSCSGLTSITIPNSVTSIGWGAFIGSGLTSITIPNSVKIIEDWAFAWCTNLTSITVESGNQYFDSRNNCNAIIDSNNQLVVGCKNTVIPNSVTAIGWCAFFGCTGLTSVNIPNNVTSIHDGAFSHSGLVYITLPNKLTSIASGSFQNCYSLTDIYSIATNVPNANLYTFTNPGNITLHVPSESLNSYKTTEPWNEFKSIVSLDNSDTQGGQKCSKPTISIADGRIVFSCETPDVSYQWVISTPNGTNGTDDSIWPGTLSVFATKSGYQNSDVATYTFPSLAGDVNQDGVVNVADHVKLSEIIMGKE